MQDNDLIMLQRQHVNREKARRAVETRHYTDRPGSQWHLSEVGTPKYNGVHGRAAIFPTAAGYEVYHYTYAGAQVASRNVRGLDTAFRQGQRWADGP